ncbi:flagellar hook-length control protein FliK [Sulfurimonas marina]|uniref:Flagellar hook-length control protein FliK n=1 Tax=Sulfurimonas marina TaxID=2590551 RepID=A0A7M3V905_9BACT|nr:flagellar hook-length control protein FliK [Sulfurimonas marina]QOP40238.1 flagellar hook-length control protein FliK [Sulfurimonas marina]
MIALTLKSDPKTESSLPLASKEATASTLSFASFLDGLGEQKGDLKLAQNGALVLSLQENATDEKPKDTKTASSSILSLLQGEELETIKEDLKTLELNPQITKDKTVSELKVLIQEAKQYLKNKITSLEGFKKSEIASLPKTLKGLTQVAQKFGIDVSKITLEEVKQSVKTIETTEVSESIKTKAEPKLKEDPKVSTKPAVARDIKTTQKSVKNESDDAVDTIQVKEQAKEQVKTEQTAAKQTPLFKAQTKVMELSTQQIVAAKVTTEVEKPQKQKSENTLELLLRGQKAIQKDTSLTADFSVATAKVIAPTAKTDAQQNLESLLNGESASESHHTKTDSLNVNKADSFEVKLNEAKQMIKYLSQDVKQAIEDYKAPFTRVKVQLNPQKLGEVDLTVVQRGKNLHINLSSNNAAINTLAMNANDLKIQLNNTGIQNASLNFSNTSQGDQSGAGSNAHQQQQNRQNAQEEYGYFQVEETNEEIVSSLEIVVPHYA